MQRHTKLQLAVVLWVVTAAGCQDSSSELQQVDRSISSWAQTLRTASDLWLSDRVPAKYLRQTLEAADRSLDKLTKQINDINDREQDKQSLRSRLRALQDCAETMKLALVAQDREKIKAALASIDPSSATGGGG